MDKDRQPINDPEEKAGFNGRTGGGDSGGGAYPNPHRGKEGGKTGGLMGHGGQSEMEYHGHGQLGEQDVEGENANAPARKAGRSDDRPTER